jgi:hypothetical protein
MGEILGIGVTHYPPGLVPDEHKPWPLVRMLRGDRIPPDLKNPINWPAPLREEWGTDEGISSHKQHRTRLFNAFCAIRQEIDAFRPDLIVIWGDDQYENFQEDIIPAFCVLAYDHVDFRPFTRLGDTPNIWGEPQEKVFTCAGHQEGGRFLARGLLEQGIDAAYAYKPLHKDGLGHAFANTVLYLDKERKGFPYPIVPVTVNCYGKNVVRMHGGSAKVHSTAFDPPSPSPRRCFEFGEATARALADSPWRVVLMASSSWSHGFLTEKHSLLYPDIEADRVLLQHLKSGNYSKWKDVKLEDVEQSGQQEVLNWFCLVGAMHELKKKVEVVEWAESWAFNSKCFAIFS